MQRIYQADSLTDAQLLVDMLEQSGVPSLVFHQNGSGGVGELPVTFPEVWIRRELDRDKALGIIQRFENRPEARMDRVCSRCGETNPDSFEICWLCHNTLDN